MALRRFAVRRMVRRIRQPDALGAFRRAVGSAIDSVWAPAVKRCSRAPRAIHDAEAEPRLALITVNFSTTRYLKLMLTTLVEQAGLDLVHRVVVVDNGSRDGGRDFLRALAACAPRVTLVERRHFLTHAHGMRSGARALRAVERDLPPSERANYLLFCDPDVIWRNPDALLDLVGATIAHDATLAGEIRHGVNPMPDIQASLFLVRRDVYDDPSIPPLVVHGSPAYQLQRAIFDRGDPVVDFPTNRGGYALHRGRTGVAAAAAHRGHAYARATARWPHYMGLSDGAVVWATVEARHAPLLEPAGEAALLDLLSARLGRIGPAKP
jgi:hypothetical protein